MISGVLSPVFQTKSCHGPRKGGQFNSSQTSQQSHLMMGLLSYLQGGRRDRLHSGQRHADRCGSSLCPAPGTHHLPFPAFQVIKREGTGTETPMIGDRVFVHYTGWLLDGTKFDSSLERKDRFSFDLGKGGHG